MRKQRQKYLLQLPLHPAHRQSLPITLDPQRRRVRTREQRQEQLLQLPLHAVHKHVLPGRQQPRAARVALQRVQRSIRAAHQRVRHAVECLLQVHLDVGTRLGYCRNRNRIRHSVDRPCRSLPGSAEHADATRAI